MSISNRTSLLASTTTQTTITGLTPLPKGLSPASHHQATCSLRPHTTRLPALSGLTPPGYLLSPASHHQANCSLRPHTTRLTALSGLTPPGYRLSPASHHQATCSLRPHTTRLPALSGLTLPGKLLSPDSLLFGCFQLLIFTDLYKQQNQFGRPRIKIKNQLNPEVMSSRNEEICNLKRLAQLNFLN